MIDSEQRKPTKGVDETTAAWAAGIIDTAGRFSVTITPEGRYDVDLQVTLPNVSEYEQIRVLTRLVTMFGGRISGSRTDGYIWRLPGHVLRNVLASFGRFIVLQSEQASVASDLFAATEREREDDFEMDADELDMRANLHYTMETVNRRRYEK